MVDVKTKLIILSLFLIFSSVSFATEEYNLWATMNCCSYHFQDTSKYNGQNFGLGLKYQLNKDFAVQSGYYSNSYSRTTIYFSGNYTPLHFWEKFSAGIALGVGTGYVSNNKYAWRPGGAGTLNYQNGHWGIGFYGVPKTSQNPAVIGLQFEVAPKGIFR